MLRPVCVGCNIETRCEQNGAFVRTSPGNARACDVYRCPICGVQIATGFGRESIPDRGVTVVADLVEDRPDPEPDFAVLPNGRFYVKQANKGE